MYFIPYYGELSNQQLVTLLLIGAIVAFLLLKGVRSYYNKIYFRSDSKYDDTEVKSFQIDVQIPDLPDQTAEGGFYLYFTSPDLKLRKMMSPMFGSNSIVSCNFDIRDRQISLGKFRKMIPKMSIESKSRNLFNTSGIKWSINLTNGRTITGTKFMNPKEKHNSISGPIFLNNNL